MDYKSKKVIGMGVITELTGLSERQVRYYESKGLVFPERTKGGSRKYSFHDVERLIDVASKLEDGWRIQDIKDREKRLSTKQRDDLIRGQLNSAFRAYPPKK
ncbi:MerR family transcriptional regulator [Exiguobacterium sp. s36]|uniref:MerR family transcriptional regulator n=1 Tax=Exiguobacterium sp. s36 TaxID=2751227 RepID=UPI001BE6032D|nr:MerR family transcriptional regulator [Exiguobacterium sp. s36]